MLQRPKDHVTRVVDDDVEMPRFGKYLLHRTISQLLGADIQLRCSEIHVLLRRKSLRSLYLFGITSGSLEHGGVNRVSGLRQAARG